MSDVLVLRGIEKSFGSNHVLHDVGLSLPGGAVTVLMGANGAGKSTLVKILSGVHARDAGEILLGGAPYSARTPLEARAAGVVTVHQGIDDGVVPDLDVAENLTLEDLATGRTGVFYRRSRVRARAREVAARMGLELDVTRPVRELGLAERQLVGIARAMAADPRLLILDEPTSSLSAREAGRLFALIDRLREQGVAILYISHRTSDIERIADRVVTMRDGRVSGTFEGRPPDVSAAIEAMLGHIVSPEGFRSRAGGSAALELRGLRLRPDADPLDLGFADGEIVAVTGLVGSGKSALAEMLFGLRRPASGTMRLDGEAYAPDDPAEAIGRGVFMVPKDRAGNAVVPGFDLSANLSLPFLKRHSRLGIVRRRAERASAAAMIERLGIVCRSPDDAIGTLSGGNQQKIVVARWLSQPCRVLLLDEPFQGVDIGARRDIGRTLRRGVDADGRATIVFVSELDEALEVADRIVVMAHHGVAGIHANEGLDLERVLADVAAAGRAA